MITIASKDLADVDGLKAKRLINDSVFIDLKNKRILVRGMDEIYAPNGSVIKEIPFFYEVDNIPAIDAVAAVEAVVEVKDASGNIVTPAVSAVAAVVGVPANPRFDNYIASSVGTTIAAMIQGAIDKM